MNIHLCGGPTMPVELPDLGVPCCYGSANGGPQECTCWEPVYDLEQCKPVPLTREVFEARLTPCIDCAYRGGSPERRDAPGYAGGAENLEQLVRDGVPFYCHQGIRKPIRYRHPSGAEVAGHPASYAPPIANGVPYKADGTPANICAGWARRRLKFLFEVQR